MDKPNYGADDTEIPPRVSILTQVLYGRTVKNGANLLGVFGAVAVAGHKVYLLRTAYTQLAGSRRNLGPPRLFPVRRVRGAQERGRPQP